MGYISIQINKAKGSADTGASDHIERKTMPKNADPTRTHLNRELVEFPDGVADRTEAISHRIRTAGIKRKITPDQVRAIRIVLSGTHEDLMKVQDEGRLDEWCADNLQWLHCTFGRENTVSAVLHMDEHTPHIHATVVPIVTGERRKAKKKQAEGKRTYRKKTDTVRLCADDVLTREKLVAYHDSYAEAMAKYGLQRGVRGSEARHVTTAQYYRDLKRQTGELEANVQQLQTEQRQAEQQLDEVKREIKSEKLEAAKTEAKAALVTKVSSLLGSGRLKELEADNRTLQNEVAVRDESIKLLQQQMQRQQEEHSRQLIELQAKHRREMTDKETEHQKKVSFLKSIISKAQTWFPLFQELVYMEKFCLKVGFNERQTATLISGKSLFYEGELYSEEHRRKFMTERAGFQVVKDPKDKSKLALAINRQLIGEWFKEQFDRLFSSIRKTVAPHRKGKGLGL
ncbi:MAG TPA: plasmid recombination protein [Candidatus Caccoplasma intestinavium]|uniref:Plasmid recombination protein n=1 Tax=Candidatus Caccoplasma intestinavium TaxID=2840716 RepID=A0A9D1KDM1_9BACT|nr:plasmid recombination protein [Candidatus Caccoplasma intestinavium]